MTTQEVCGTIALSGHDVEKAHLVDVVKSETSEHRFVDFIEAKDDRHNLVNIEHLSPEDLIKCYEHLQDWETDMIKKSVQPNLVGDDKKLHSNTIEHIHKLMSIFYKQIKG